MERIPKLEGKARNMIVSKRGLKFGLGLVAFAALAILVGQYFESVRRQIADSSVRRQVIADFSLCKTTAVKNLPLENDLVGTTNSVLRTCRSQLDAFLNLNEEPERNVTNNLRIEIGLHMKWLELQKQSSERAARIEVAIAKLSELGVSRDDLVEHLKEEILDDANCQMDDVDP